MPLDMNPEIRAQWCAALRSGDYQQGERYLHRSDGRRCCLGVLVGLAEKAGVIGPGQESCGWFVYNGYPDCLPEAVYEWAGLETGNPWVDDPSTPPGRIGLAVLNDEYHRTFAQIADLIDGGES